MLLLCSGSYRYDYSYLIIGRGEKFEFSFCLQLMCHAYVSCLCVSLSLVSCLCVIILFFLQSLRIIFFIIDWRIFLLYTRVHTSCTLYGAIVVVCLSWVIGLFLFLFGCGVWGVCVVHYTRRCPDEQVDSECDEILESQICVQTLNSYTSSWWYL